MRRKQEQLEFSSIIADSFKSHEKRLLKYMTENLEEYRVSAAFITPSLDDKVAIFSRVAFAILSANTTFDSAVKALDFVLQHKGKVTDRDMIVRGMVPAKGKYCNKLWAKVKSDPTQFRKSEAESWHDYRIRLQKDIMGLGLTKASFAACLLYPNEADLACVDTWIQKVFLGNQSFKTLGLQKYLEVEGYVRKYAQKFGCSTFLSQWMIWDHARRSVTSHNIFPGSHK